MTTFRSNPTRVFYLTLLLLAFGLRLWRIDVQDIWWDEARNIDVALRPLTAIPRAPELDIHPPGYFLLLHLWMKGAGHTAFATRFLSAWFGVLLIPLLVVLARRLRISAAAPFAALYAALSPFLIGEAQETRMYTLAFVLVTLTGLFFWRTLQGRARAWVGLGMSMALAVLTHYSTAFVLVALYLYALLFLLFRMRVRLLATSPSEILRALRPLVAAGLLSLVLFLPQAPRAYEQIAPYGNPNLVVPSFLAYLGQLWHAYTVGMALEENAILYDAIILALSLVGLGLWLLKWGQRRITPLTFLLTACLVPVFLYYVVLIERATFAPRYISFVLPFLALLLGMALAGWWRGQRWLGLGGTVVVVLLLAQGIYADQFNPKYFREDTSGLARWLMENARADDLVLIDVPYPLGFYYPRYSRDPEQPPPSDPAHLAPAYYLFVDIHRVAEQLTRLAAGKRRVFWVQWFKSDTDPRGVVETLLRAYGAHEGRRAFRGYTVDWYRIPPGVEFRLDEGAKPVRVMFGGQVATVAVAAGQAAPLPADILRASDEGPAPRPVWVAVDWQRAGGDLLPLKVSARLWDPLGQMVAQDDRRLLNDRHLALPYWEEGERARNVYLLRLPPGTPPGAYTVTLRVYDPGTLSPLLAQDEQGKPLGTDVTVATVRVRKPRVFPRLTPTALVDAPIALVEYNVPAREVAPGATLPIHLLWVKQASTAEDPLRVALVLVDERGQPYSFMDIWPVPWYPTHQWGVGEVVRSVIPWRIAPDTPNGEYQAYLQLVDQSDNLLGQVGLGLITVKGRSHRFEAPPPEHVLSPPPQFDDIALLLGYDVDGEIAPGARLTITLTWKALTSSQANYKVSVQVLDAANQVLAQEDHIPLRGEAPTTSWLSGEILRDRFDLTLPAQLPPGPKRVIVSMYDENTLARVPVMSGEGARLTDYVELFRVP